jgi:hypothetical protein
VVVSSLDLALVIIGSLGGALLVGSVAQGLGWSVVPWMLGGGGLTLFSAYFWHFRVLADKEAAYVRATDASTAVKLAGLQPPPPPPTDGGLPAVDEDAERRAMLDAMLTFFHAGEKAGGFSAGLLSPGVVGSDTWEDLTDFYVSPEGGGVLRVVAGNVGTVWNHGHGLDSTIRGLRAGKIPLPDMKVPVVNAYVPVAAQRNAPRKGTTRKPAAAPDAEVVDRLPPWPEAEKG